MTDRHDPDRGHPVDPPDSHGDPHVDPHVDPRSGPSSPEPVTDLLAVFLEAGTVDPDDMAGLDPTQRADLLEALAELSSVRTALGTEAMWGEPPLGLERTIIDAIALEADVRRTDGVVIGPEIGATHHADPAVAPSPIGHRADEPASSAAAVGAGTGEPVALADRLERSERRVQRLRAFAVAASFVAVLAAIVAIVGTVGRTDPPVAAPPVSASTTVTATTAPVAPAEPIFDVRRSLVASDLVPGVTGEVQFKETSSGLHIYFDAENLPTCESGTLYEAWLRTDQGNISAGTFHGGTDVTLWGGVDLPAVRGFWVSIQDEGNHTPSDKKVVSASLAAVPSTTTTSADPAAPTTTADPPTTTAPTTMVEPTTVTTVPS